MSCSQSWPDFPVTTPNPMTNFGMVENLLGNAQNHTWILYLVLYFMPLFLIGIAGLACSCFCRCSPTSSTGLKTRCICLIHLAIFVTFAIFLISLFQCYDVVEFLRCCANGHSLSTWVDLTLIHLVVWGIPIIGLVSILGLLTCISFLLPRFLIAPLTVALVVLTLITSGLHFIQVDACGYSITNDVNIVFHNASRTCGDAELVNTLCLLPIHILHYTSLIIMLLFFHALLRPSYCCKKQLATPSCANGSTAPNVPSSKALNSYTGTSVFDPTYKSKQQSEHAGTFVPTVSSFPLHAYAGHTNCPYS